MRVNLLNASLSDQLYYIARFKHEDDETQESKAYIIESGNQAAQFDYTEGHFEPYQHDYSKYPESKTSLTTSFQNNGEKLCKV